MLLLASARGAVHDREHVSQLHSIAARTELDDEVRVISANIVAREACDLFDHRHPLHAFKLDPARRSFAEMIDAHGVGDLLAP